MQLSEGQNYCDIQSILQLKRQWGKDLSDPIPPGCKRVSAKIGKFSTPKKLSIPYLLSCFSSQALRKNAEILYVKSKKKKSLRVNQKNLKYLRYTIKRYQLIGIKPPVSIFVELKMAKFLAKL